MARRIRAVVSCVSSRLLRDGIRPLPRGGERRVHRPRVSASAARQDASGVCLARRLCHRHSSGAHCGRVFWVVNVAPRSTRGGPRCASDSAEGAAAVVQS